MVERLRETAPAFRKTMIQKLHAKKDATAMKRKLSETDIVKDLAEKAIQRITRKVIADLLRMEETLSGDDSALKTTWDAICVQVQDEHSYAWDAYDTTVRALVDAYVCDLPLHEREAIWLQTEPGSDWDWEEPETRDAFPVVDDDISQYITNEYIYREAGRWSNARIRSFIERSRMSD